MGPIARFAVDDPPDTPGPWVVLVAPATIATTGETPGAPVIEGHGSRSVQADHEPCN
jgi:hypothetical protein